MAFVPANDLYEKIAQSHPKLARGRLWCTTCAFSYSFATSGGLQRGWPKCCGYTMTIDSPEERIAQAKAPDHG